MNYEFFNSDTDRKKSAAKVFERCRRHRRQREDLKNELQHVTKSLQKDNGFLNEQKTCDNATTASACACVNKVQVWLNHTGQQRERLSVRVAMLQQDGAACNTEHARS